MAILGTILQLVVLGLSFILIVLILLQRGRGGGALRRARARSPAARALPPARILPSRARPPLRPLLLPLRPPASCLLSSHRCTLSSSPTRPRSAWHMATVSSQPGGGRGYRLYLDGALANEITQGGRYYTPDGHPIPVRAGGRSGRRGRGRRGCAMPLGA